MSPAVAVVVLLGLVALTTALGVLLRARAGRVRRSDGGRVVPADLGAAADELGARATLVQLSTPTCAQCPGTARLLRALAAEHAGVAHLEIDLTRAPQVADRFAVLQTPTTLLLDADRRVRARIGGAPRRDALDRELLAVLGGPDAR
jgi:thiol-disulfide isomerase/thioredoxin